ncbi:U6 snRNA phosphodiesterase Usb1 [Xylariaceae sp. FL1651]|nr:U6 snRNA phosphodiesterase Usb1 [Xylariaceae sp. FL1651]
MALVDYSSDSSGSAEGTNSKKQKISHKQTATDKADELPPLPSAFHDLYASTVRVSTNDDPTLHQGRKRVNPHKVGNWPSHLYIEWHPKPAQRSHLSALLSQLEDTLSSSLKEPIVLTSFLTSELGAPQPLHISLSRPIVLSTAQKDDFLARLESSIRGSGIAPFELAPLGLEWHRTYESARSFLVLRVGCVDADDAWHLLEGAGEDVDIASQEDRNNDGIAAAGGRDGNRKRNSKTASASKEIKGVTNPQLTSLLRRSNALVTGFGQPALYAFATGSDFKSSSSPASASQASPDATSETANSSVGNAFHISIAWSFAVPTAELRRATEDVFNSSFAERPTSGRPTDSDTRRAATRSGGRQPDKDPTSTTPATIRDAVCAMRVRVNGIKAKIGNVVTHVPLPDPKSRKNGSGEGWGLFGA